MKKVYVQSHSPLAFGAHVGWEDVWLRVCSGKRTLRLAPCLISREDLRWKRPGLVVMPVTFPMDDAPAWSIDPASGTACASDTNWGTEAAH